MKIKINNTYLLLWLMPLPIVLLPLLLRLIVGSCSPEGEESDAMMNETSEQNISSVIAGIASSVMPLVHNYFQESTENGDGAGNGIGLCFDRVAELCDLHGHRQAGSANLESAIDWQIARLEEEGFEVKTVDAMIPRWRRGTEQATLMRPLIG